METEPVMDLLFRVMLAAMLLAMALASSLVYRLRLPKSDEEGAIDLGLSHRSFGWFYLYLRVSTPMLVVAGLFWPHVIVLPLHHSLLISAIGVGVAALGLAGFLWSMASLGDSYSPCYEAQTPREIVTVGPYRYVRHPIYASNLILLAGMTIAGGSGWMAANWLSLLAFYIFIARAEEQELLRRYPAYRGYYESSCRFLPGV